MSDARELLRQFELTYEGLPNPWPDDPDGGALRPAIALRAVLDLHKRCPDCYDRHCAACDATTWPCRTVDVITEALTGGSDE